MKLYSKSIMLVFLHVLPLLAVPGMLPMPALAPPIYMPGVKPGDWSTYTMMQQTNYPGYENWTGIGTFTVMTVVGTNVTLLERIDFSNGTSRTSTGIVDVDSGIGNAAGYVIAANLVQGDLIYTNPSDSSGFKDATINETTTLTYLGRPETINHLNKTPPVTHLPGGYNITLKTNYWWYKNTGAMAEFSVSQKHESISGTLWMSIEVSITGMVAEFPPAIILPLLMVLTMFAVVFAKRKFLRKQNI